MADLNFLEIGERLRKAREDTGLSQEQVAKKAGISARSVVRYEQGNPIRSNLTLKALADATSVSVEWLKTGEGPMRGESVEDEATTARTDTTGESTVGMIDPSKKFFVIFRTATATVKVPCMVAGTAEITGALEVDAQEAIIAQE